MSFATYAASHIHLANDRISNEEAQRQERAAQEVLARLASGPGVILADEVGMGKTFVALAVAVSVLLEDPDRGPVVVMSPPSLREKWPREWDVFRQKCLASDRLRDRFRAAPADSGVEFLRLLDDSKDRRKHLIFLTHGALHRAMSDGFAKLAVIKRAFKGRSSLKPQRKSFTRFAGRLLRLEWVENRSPGLLGSLLDRPYADWLRTIQNADEGLKKKIQDDPAPLHLTRVLEEMSGNELDGVVEMLRELPQRESENSAERLQQARESLGRAMGEVWAVALGRTSFRSPLLIFDEAHHVKNPSTRLASLFATEEAATDSKFFDRAGPLAGKFDRMLFLTATPFQLGHAELIRVLERFEGISWTAEGSRHLREDKFRSDLRGLGEVLDEAQSSALRLDRCWGRLGPEHLIDADGAPLEVDRWWDIQGRHAEGEGVVAQVVEQVRQTQRVMKAAEAALSPWVIRYTKGSHLTGRPDVLRRILRPGAGILDGGDESIGLDISPEALLPFLLAGRAQGMLSACRRGRALFAEGLASSFEAYVETRKGNQCADEDVAVENEEPLSPELEWYLRHLDESLSLEGGVRYAHPKIRATAERAVALWRVGEKVLIFCHYRATGRALRQHISRLLRTEIIQLGQTKLPGRTPVEVEQTLQELGERFFQNVELRDGVTDWLHAIVDRFELGSVQKDDVVEILRRFVRTPSFLARYLPLESRALVSAFSRSVEPFDAGLHWLRQEVQHFCSFLAERCLELERERILEALKGIQTGSHSGKEIPATFDAAEVTPGEEASAALLPNVRLANGEVRKETRERLLHAFNTPFFPEILVASSVMEEGLDLHLNCRHVIHHDLCWNPSTLEQRTGRVDRIGSMSERLGQSIQLFLPYVGGTQDEKMFRVVRDRERWFQIIMGEKYQVDEVTTDQRAERIPLPTQVQQALTMRLQP